MSKKRESLKANGEEILSSLPKELHDDLKTTTGTEPTSTGSDAEISAIKAELVANPSVDESASSSEL